MVSARSNSLHGLVLAEVRTVVQFLQQHQLRAALGRFGDVRFDDREIGVGAAVVALLDQGDGQGGLLHVDAAPERAAAIVGGRHIHDADIGLRLSDVRDPAELLRCRQEVRPPVLAATAW